MDFVTYQFESPSQFFDGKLEFADYKTREDEKKKIFSMGSKSLLRVIKHVFLFLCFFFNHCWRSSLAELSDLLEEGGFHESPEAQVNTFLSLLVQYQGKNYGTVMGR